jgi:hypothetical protein
VNKIKVLKYMDPSIGTLKDDVKEENLRGHEGER